MDHWQTLGDGYKLNSMMIRTDWPVAGRYNLLAAGANEYFPVEDYATLEEAKNAGEKCLLQSQQYLLERVNKLEYALAEHEHAVKQRGRQRPEDTRLWRDTKSDYAKYLEDKYADGI